MVFYQGIKKREVKWSNVLDSRANLKVLQVYHASLEEGSTQRDLREFSLHDM